MRAHWVDRPGSFLFQFTAVCGLTVLLAWWGGQVLSEARLATSEQLALATLRQIGQAAEIYYMSHEEYPLNLTVLGAPSSVPPYLAPELIGDGTTVTKQGYMFLYLRHAPHDYTLRANPIHEGISGARHFFTTQAIGQVHVTTEPRDATAQDPLDH